MNELLHPSPTNKAIGDYCLVELVDAAETATGGIEENSGLTNALNSTIFTGTEDGDIELMCRQCPVTCTIKDVGKHTLALVHNREDCVSEE